MNRLSSREVIRNPVMTEDAVNLLESENKLTFIVDPSADRAQVKKAVEDLYEVKVQKVNICNTFSGQKKAFVRLRPQFRASDVATKLGLL